MGEPGTLGQKKSACPPHTRLLAWSHLVQAGALLPAGSSQKQPRPDALKQFPHFRSVSCLNGIEFSSQRSTLCALVPPAAWCSSPEEAISCCHGVVVEHSRLGFGANCFQVYLP